MSLSIATYCETFCFNFDELFSWDKSKSTQKSFFVFRYTAFVLKWLQLSLQKYRSRIPDVSKYYLKNFMFVFGLGREIFQTAYFLILHLEYLKSHRLLFLSLYKTCRFSRKTVQNLIFEVVYLENSSANFNDFGLILQDFERPFR